MLAFPLLACCYFGGGGGAAPTAPVAPVAPVPPGAVPPAPPTTAPTLGPIERPLVGGVERALAGRQLFIDLPTTAPAAAPAEAFPGLAGALWAYRIELAEPEGAPSFSSRDLPCVVTSSLEAEIGEEIRRREPEAGALSIRPFPVRDASLTVVEVVPAARYVAPDNDQPLAFFAVDVGSHVILFRLAVWDLSPIAADPHERAAALALGESIIGTMRRGDFTWTAQLEGSTYGDLFQSITAPSGWVLRTSGCCNEEPPYVTRFRESIIPLRPLGEPPRARVTARWGTCPAGTPSRAGTMFGRPMTWSRTATGLCWDEIAPDGLYELGVSWHLRGATEADLDSAVAIAATAFHED